jgi:hypothetical protein
LAAARPQHYLANNDIAVPNWEIRHLRDRRSGGKVLRNGALPDASSLDRRISDRELVT